MDKKYSLKLNLSKCMFVSKCTFGTDVESSSATWLQKEGLKPSGLGHEFSSKSLRGATAGRSNDCRVYIGGLLKGIGVSGYLN